MQRTIIINICKITTTPKQICSVWVFQSGYNRPWQEEWGGFSHACAHGARCFIIRPWLQLRYLWTVTKICRTKNKITQQLTRVTIIYNISNIRLADFAGRSRIFVRNQHCYNKFAMYWVNVKQAGPHKEKLIFKAAQVTGSMTLKCQRYSMSISKVELACDLVSSSEKEAN